jgi:hypothetical protein
VLDEVRTGAAVTPKPAFEPSDPESLGFTLVVEGPSPEELRKAWNALCSPSADPPSPEFKKVYQFLTTVSGSKFRFRGGNHITLKENLQKLLQEALDGTAVKVHSDV